MTLSNIEAANALALEAAQQRVASSDALLQKIQSDLSTRHYSIDDQARLNTLHQDIEKARARTELEIAARQDLKQSYDESTFAKKDADPAVVSQQKELAAVRKANKPVMHGKDNLVNTLCQPCIAKDIDKLMDCDTPYYVKFGKGGGPQYKDCHDFTLGNFSGWDALIKSERKTVSEKNVLVAMSANEGDLDSVQAYDSEIISVGAMQKTVNSDGAGELPKQLAEFNADTETAAVFTRELGEKGYSLAKNIIGKNKDGTPKYGNDDLLYFTDPKNPAAQPMTGAKLDQFIQNHADRRLDTLGPFRSLGRTPEFQRKQVLDFNDRLIGALDKVPSGYNCSIGDYVTSEYASALVVDQDVNRPGYVKKDFGAALDKFYIANPKAAKDPTLWTRDEAQQYQPKIVEFYQNLRRGTDMATRAANLFNFGLSSLPESLEFPP